MSKCIRILICSVAVMVFSACSMKPIEPLAPLDCVHIGIVSAVQPQATRDLLAGYIPELREFASSESLRGFNEDVLNLTTQNADSSRNIKVVSERISFETLHASSEKSALTHWVQVARNAHVDVLIVPQILDWHERDGSSMGIVSPAAVFIQYYLIDAQSGSMIARSVFNEQQKSLSGDLLNFSLFFKRGGKWLTARELASEGTMRMIKEFGL